MKTEKTLRDYIAEEMMLAASEGDPSMAFHHLERAHVLGQGITYEHTRVHWRMLKMGLRRRDLREVWGQIIRIIGAATKTPFGIYPTGNTGGADVYFFKRMSIPEDLEGILRGTKASGRG